LKLSYKRSIFSNSTASLARAVATAQFDLMRVRNERAKFLELLISAASARAGRRAKKVSPGALASLDRHERRAASRRQKGLGNLS
jgi:hypothetical protein